MKFHTTRFLSLFTEKSLPCFLMGMMCLLASGLWSQNCPSPNPNPALTAINQITDTSAFVNWPAVPAADSFLVEFGPAGFPPGAGLVETASASAATLDSLNPCVAYHVYIYSICSNGQVSAPAGPFSFTTASSDVCTYSFQLFDTFGDGWNGAFLTVAQLDQATTMTLNNGLNTTVTYQARASVPVCVNYTAGGFPFEVSYRILDAGGSEIFADGPGPMVGDVFSFVACNATCAAPKSWTMKDVNATNAVTTWAFLPGTSGGSVFLEYGPLGFQLGTGTSVTVPAGQTSFTMTGLQENTWYNAYLGVNCGADSSKVIGPLQFKTLWLRDVGVTSISPNADDFCNLGPNDTITVGLTNFGQLPQTLFEFYYAVNGEAASIPIPQDGLFTGVVGNDSTQIIQFETTWDFSLPGHYVIEAWTQMEGDSNITNDTFRVEFLNAFPNPISEDFEDLSIPTTWTTSAPFAIVPAGNHNNPTALFGVNLYSGNPTFNLTTGRVGPVAFGDSLTFDYRMVNWFAGTDPTTLSEQDSLIVQISDDCEETYETILVIDGTTHFPTDDLTKQVIFLDDYDGLTIHVRFLGKWGSGDYWLDLDNIQIQGQCPVSFGSLLDVKGSFENATNGSASIAPIAGTGPYQFAWSTGQTQTGGAGLLQNLGPGGYFVVITDAKGCSETVPFEVGSLVATDEAFGVEAISLYPNPTSAIVNLDVRLSASMDVVAKVLDLSGRTVLEYQRIGAFELREQFNLGNQPPGLYIVQVVADGKPYYAKVMVAR